MQTPARDNLDAARHFDDAAAQAFEALAAMSEMGSPRAFRNPTLSGLRLWRIPGFERSLICVLRSMRRNAIVSLLPRIWPGEDLSSTISSKWRRNYETPIVPQPDSER